MLSLLARAFAVSLVAAMSSCVVATAATVPLRAVANAPSVLEFTNHQVTIGSTVDRQNGDQNPYGLAISPVSAGRLHAGDLVVCNFNNALNIQGLGTTIEVLRPQIGARPERLLANPTLTGCAALVLGPTGNPWVAAYIANDNPIVSPGGALLSPLNTYPWTLPFGQTFSGTSGPHGVAAFYESNAADGSIVRINITAAGFTFDKIVERFSVNHGVPGSILGPSGLTYDSKRDVLYVVDGNTNRLVAIAAPGLVSAGGIHIEGGGFTGTFARNARVVYAGSPLAAPISAALLFNGDLVLGNTSDNRLIEITPAGRVVGTRLVDAGPSGAIFGIAASGTSLQTTRIFFNDDNSNTVQALTH